MIRLFGGYVHAYAAAGLPVLRTATGALGIRSMRALVQGMMAEVIERAVRGGAIVSRTPVWNILLLNGALRVKISVASCRWRVALRSGAQGA